MPAKKDPDLHHFLTVAIVLLSLLAVSILGIDIWEVATGQVDLNRHWPFFVPLVLGGLIFIAVKVLIHDNGTGGPTKDCESGGGSCRNCENCRHGKKAD